MHVAWVLIKDQCQKISHYAGKLGDFIQQAEEIDGQVMLQHTFNYIFVVEKPP